MLAAAIYAGTLTWAAFLLTCVLSGAEGLTVEVDDLYGGGITAMLEILGVNLMIFAGMSLLGVLLWRRRTRRTTRPIIVFAILWICGNWAVRGGRQAAELGLGGDLGALALATAPHAIGELGILCLPLLMALSHLRPRVSIFLGGTAGLIACAVLETYL
ncbi:hypothetical protein [Miltoncostaea oceani]|uniref:hypothetical protein n=1 Tax=Miltoncostaea oceani TaxID=2843216 RepID=UPI001C3CD03C|nr:hypothetical protein [Miltoncostaea oceani]